MRHLLVVRPHTPRQACVLPAPQAGWRPRLRAAARRRVVESGARPGGWRPWLRPSRWPGGALVSAHWHSGVRQSLNVIATCNNTQSIALFGEKARGCEGVFGWEAERSSTRLSPVMRNYCVPGSPGLACTSVPARHTFHSCRYAARCTVAPAMHSCIETWRSMSSHEPYSTYT